VSKDKQQLLVQGLGASPGVAVGPVYLIASSSIRVPQRDIDPEDVNPEICRFEEALIETRKQIRQIQSSLGSSSRSGDPSILDAHLLVLDDRSFIEEIVAGVRDTRKNIEFVVSEAAEKYASALEAVEDEYLRERVADVRDVGRRIVRNLCGKPATTADEVPPDHIIVAQDLAPSETAAMRKDRILGFATDLGSPTSHTAVMARALELPAVLGLHDITGRVRQDDHILVDGYKGLVIINPSQEELARYGAATKARMNIERQLGVLQHEPAETSDGHRIVLSANVEGLEELDAVIQYGAEGVGLFRSEFLYLAQDRVVTEEEQTKAYCETASRLSPAPVIIRTLDLGGDKFFSGVTNRRESNPFLGCRSIRLCLKYPKYFKQQLRAILRASVNENVKIMYPMITNLSEIEQANGFLAEAKADLAAHNVQFHDEIEVGIMVEVPSAALMADVLAEHVDFFSIGTNDLIQYTVAVDRGNEDVAYLYKVTHPAVLKLIRNTIEAAHSHGIWVGLCGEMAANPLMTALLLGMGVEELSVSPRAVPLVKDAVRSLSFGQAEELAKSALMCKSAADVLEICRELTREVAPEILELV